MTILVLGPGCPKCKKMYSNVQEAVEKSGRTDINVEKIENLSQIMSFGVAITPALIIDGVVKASGKVLSVDEMLKLIKS